MNELIEQILAWPVIAQGALGSGLFSLILYLGQRGTLFLSGRLSRYSHRRRVDKLRFESIKYKITLTEQPDRAALFGVLLYKAFSRTIRGLIWLTLGLGFQLIIPVFGIIGCLGALFYLFDALLIFKPIDTSVDKDQRIKEIDTELAELGKRNKAIQPTAEASAD